MTVEPDRMLRMTRRFNAAPERVFDAWISPATVRKWLFASPADETYTATIDARVGGAYTITARREGVDYTASGQYLEIDRPRRVVFTFEMRQFSPNTDRITVELAPDGTGCTMLFTQEGIDIAQELALTAGQVSGSEIGWSNMFEALAQQLASAEPATDT